MLSVEFVGSLAFLPLVDGRLARVYKWLEYTIEKDVSVVFSMAG